ncbi:MAG: M1 family aminopeptidase, partial [Pseudomonadota bacterium]|nr:M1 family aminopeptidase [Pseudomonadota bacterium]
METKTPPADGRKMTYLKNYRPPAFTIPETELELWLDADETRIRTRHRIRRQPHGEGPLQLHGESLQLDKVTLDGALLGPDDYTYDADGLTLPDVPDSFELVIKNRIQPRTNTSLSGLYHSAGMLCTQCEAEGFRRITFGLDRPDVLTGYSVTLYADARQYPVLLCNGNLVASGELDGGRHWTKWRDPFPKPSYLFAIVAGDLARIEDCYTTLGGKNVRLCFYAAQRDIGKCRYALGALQRAMRWDEEEYGREYDLDLYNVVAVADFNMGAMENKSLNI